MNTNWIAAVNIPKEEITRMIEYRFSVSSVSSVGWMISGRARRCVGFYGYFGHLLPLEVHEKRRHTLQLRAFGVHLHTRSAPRVTIGSRMPQNSGIQVYPPVTRKGCSQTFPTKWPPEC
jgi:hypothetical protein